MPKKKKKKKKKTFVPAPANKQVFLFRANNFSYFARFRNEFEKKLEDMPTLETSVFRAATGWSRDLSKIAKLRDASRI